MDQPQGLQQIAISSDLNEFLLLLAPEPKDETRADGLDADVDDLNSTDFRIFPTQIAAYKFAIAYALAKNLDGVERTPDTKNKWQTPAIYDDSVAALLETFGIQTEEQKHVHYKMIELAEAGLRGLKAKAEAGFDLWDVVASR